jgi:hypothetical protein
MKNSKKIQLIVVGVFAILFGCKKLADQSKLTFDLIDDPGSLVASKIFKPKLTVCLVEAERDHDIKNRTLSLDPSPARPISSVPAGPAGNKYDLSAIKSHIQFAIKSWISPLREFENSLVSIVQISTKADGCGTLTSEDNKISDISVFILAQPSTRHQDMAGLYHYAQRG